MLLCSHWNVFNIYTQSYKFVVVFSLKCIYSLLLWFHRNVFYIYIQLLSDEFKT